MTDEQTAQQQFAAALAEADAKAQAFIGPVCVAMLNGIAKSLGVYPIDRLAVAVAGILGHCVGQILSVGPLGPVMKLRRQCMQAFEDEMKKVHINAPQPAPSEHTLPPGVADMVGKLHS